MRETNGAGLAGTLQTAPDGRPVVDCDGWLPPEDAHRAAHNLAKRYGIAVIIVDDGVRATFEPVKP